MKIRIIVALLLSVCCLAGCVSENGASESGTTENNSGQEQNFNQEQKEVLGAIGSEVLLQEIAEMDDINATQEFSLSCLECQLPLGLSTGKFEYSLRNGNGDGCSIFDSNGKEVGGIEVLRSADIIFENGKLTAVDVHSNCCTLGIFTEVENEIPCIISLGFYEIDDANVNGIVESKKYWYAFLAQEDMEPVYSIFLSADESYTEENLLQIVRSISFSEGAFLTKSQMAAADKAIFGRQ